MGKLTSNTKEHEDSEKFVSSIEKLSCRINKNAQEKGFWESDDGSINSDGIKLMLLVSEVSEVLEALRKDGTKPDSHIPEFTCVEAECADILIRTLDYAKQRNLRLADAIIAKVEYNESRPYLHGKKA